MTSYLFRFTVFSSLLIIISSGFIVHSTPLLPVQSFEHIGEADAVATGDLNGDGYSDIFVVSNSYPHKVYFNNAQTIFTPSNQTFALSDASKIILEDFDNDGDLDAWIGIDNNSQDQIYLNDGNGEFSLSENSLQTSTFRTYDVIAGDIDNDGDIDVMRSSLYLGNQFLYRNDGTGQFIEEQQTVSFYKAALADYDNDGYLDIWTISGSLNIFLNDQNGNFDDDRKITGPYSDFSINIKVIDIDGDGDLDAQGFTVALEYEPPFPNTVGSQITTPRYINNSDGTFDYRRIDQLVSSGSSNDGVFIDMDIDGDLDLWAAGNRGRPSTKLITNEDGFYDSGFNTDQENERNAVSKADFNNDGLMDVVSVGLSGNVNIWLNQNNFNFIASDQSILDNNTGYTRGLAPLDVNLDGTMDFVSADSNGLSLYLNNGNLNFTHTSWTTGSCADIEVADFNQDNYPDFIAIVNNSAEIWLNNTDNTFSKFQFKNEINLSSNYGIDVADYDNDGDLDLLFTQYYGNLTLWLNNGQNEFTLTQTINGRYIDARFIDMNNNGTFEVLAVSRPSLTLTYQVFMYENNTYALNPVFTEIFGSSSPGRLVTFDMDNDGDMDVVTEQKNYEGKTTTRYILKNNNGNGFERIEVPLEAFRIIASGDFNRDGKIDLLGQSSHVYLNQGNNTFTPVAPEINHISYGALIEDFDNDGDLDVVSRSKENLQTFENLNIFIDDIFNNGFEVPKTQF